MKVHKPNPLNIFGIFMSNKSFRYLRRFKVPTFNEQLRELAAEFIHKKMIIRKDSFLIWNEKVIHWAMADSGSKSLHDSLNFICNQIMGSE
mmetsp:Transcript_39280/g.29005  ORF Transcript_39280/g.29005 Transcript_39280/m.29005 type:complete len:91 (+) Transcript_39280:88-360(+)